MLAGLIDIDRAQLSVSTAAPSFWNAADMTAGGIITGANKLTFSGDGLVGANRGVRTNTLLTTGKAYFEITVNVTTSTGCFSGFAKGGALPDITIGTGAVYCVWTNGDIKVTNSGTGFTLGAFSAGGVICCAVDIPNQTMWFRKDGGNWNGNATHNPSTAVGGISWAALGSSTIYGFTSTIGSTESSTGNFGATAFAQTAPAGFSAWDTLV